MSFFSKYFLHIVVFTFTFLGIMSNYLQKFQTQQNSVGIDGELRPFYHPFIQNLVMFISMSLNYPVYKILYWRLAKRGDGSEDLNAFTKGGRDFRTEVLLIPTISHVIATATSMMALNMTYLSSYAMLTGVIVVLVAAASVLFLGRRYGIQQTIGLCLVVFGVTGIGVADYFTGSVKASSPKATSHDVVDVLIGDGLYVVSRCFRTSQFIVEEIYVGGLDIPAMQVVGIEGLFGLAIQGFLLVPMYFIRVNRPFTKYPGSRFEDFPDAMVQIYNSTELWISVIAVIIVLAVLNFCCVTVLKELTSTTRVVITQVNILFLWAYSLLTGDDTFRPLQACGYAFTLAGIIVYNDLTCKHLRKKLKAKWTGVEEPEASNPPEAVEVAKK